MTAAECLEYDSESCPLLKKEQTSQQPEIWNELKFINMVKPRADLKECFIQMLTLF